MIYHLQLKKHQIYSHGFVAAPELFLNIVLNLEVKW